MSNQISFNWDLHYACNYRCPYCWFDGKWHQLVRQNKYPSIDEVLGAWRNIHEKYGSIFIELIGGEPFIYPHFTEIVKGLSRIHALGITTNLSVEVNDFIKEIDSSKVKVYPTFHPLFADFDKFINRVLLLKDRGMASQINYLAYPPQVKLIGYYKDKFDKYGIPLSVMTFWGQYNGITYPGGYTRQERESIQPYLGNRQGEKFQLVPKTVKGNLCHAGRRYAVIKADGTVLRCGGSHSHSIGNLFSSDFKLLDNPLQCESEFCPCNEWAFLLEEKAATKEAKEGNMPLRKRKELFRQPKEEIPRFPRLDPPYKVYWNWEITYECNYKCSYCFFWKDRKERYPPTGVCRYSEIWNSIFEKYWSCHIRFSGGEPFVYPNFIDLVAMLLERHTVDITTNLTFDIEMFLKKISPGGVSLSASFHPEFVGIEQFLDKVMLLNRKGFPTGIAFVAYPSHLKDLERYKSFVEKAGMLFKIIPFMGQFEGKKYPESYGEEQRHMLKQASINSDNQTQKELNAQWFDQNMSKKPVVNKFCRMGQMYARILPSGEVTRCCHYNSENLGSIFEEDFRIIDEPALCSIEACPCWKAMIVGHQEEKYPVFWEMPEHKVYKLNRTPAVETVHNQV